MSGKHRTDFDAWLLPSQLFVWSDVANLDSGKSSTDGSHTGVKFALRLIGL